MANRYILILYILCQLLNTSCQNRVEVDDLQGLKPSDTVAFTPVKAKEKTVDERIIEIALSQVGVEETSENWSPEIKEYLGSKGSDIKFPAYWCGSFANWVNLKAGAAHPQTGAAWTPNWFKSDRVYWKKGDNPENAIPATQAGFYFASKKRIAHIGILVDIEYGSPVVVEGNASKTKHSNNGTCVAIKYHQWYEIHQLSDWRE